MESLPPKLHEGEYVRCPTSGYIYRIVKTYKKRRFPTNELYTQMGAPVYKEVDCEMLEDIPDGPEITLEEKDQIKEFVYNYPEGVEEGNVVYCKDTNSRYLVSNKMKRKFPNDDVYEKYGSPKVKELPCDKITSIPDGPPLTEEEAPKPWQDTFMGGIFSPLFDRFFKKEAFKSETQFKGNNCLSKIANAFIRTVFVVLIGVLFYTINNKPVNKELISITAAIVFLLTVLLS